MSLKMICHSTAKMFFMYNEIQKKKTRIFFLMELSETYVLLVLFLHLRVVFSSVQPLYITVLSFAVNASQFDFQKLSEIKLKTYL